MLEKDEELTTEQLEQLLTKDRVLDFHRFVTKQIEPSRDEPMDVDDVMSFTRATPDDLLSLREVKPTEVGDLYFTKLHKIKHEKKLKAAKEKLARKLTYYTDTILKARVKTIHRVIKGIHNYRISSTGLLYQQFGVNNSSERAMNMLPKFPAAIKVTKNGLPYFDPEQLVELLEALVVELEDGDFSSFPDIKRKRSAYLQKQSAQMWNDYNNGLRSEKYKIFKRLKINHLPVSYKGVWYAASDLTEYVLGNIKYSELIAFDFSTQYIDNKGRARYRENKVLVNAHKAQKVEYKTMKSLTKKKTNHVRKFDTANQRKFLSVFKETLNVTAACNAVNISRAYLYKFANDEANKAFNFAFNALRDDVTVNVEKKFLDTVLNGTSETKYDGDGNIVTRTIKDAPPALLLRALDTLSETYKKLPETADVNVNIKQDNSHLIELASALGVTLSNSEIESYMKEKDVTPKPEAIEYAEYESDEEAGDESDEPDYLDLGEAATDEDFEIAGNALLASLPTKEVEPNVD